MFSFVMVWGSLVLFAAKLCPGSCLPLGVVKPSIMTAEPGGAEGSLLSTWAWELITSEDQDDHKSPYLQSSENLPALA